MFMFDLAFTLELIAFGLGAAFIIWAYRNEGKGIEFAKITGFFIVISAGLTLLCTSYFGMLYWGKGFYHSPYTRNSMQQFPEMTQHQGMMQQRQNMMQQRQGTMQKRPDMMQKRQNMMQQRQNMMQQRQGMMPQGQGMTESCKSCAAKQSTMPQSTTEKK